ncbi:lysoplasmalogenase [Lutibacter sp. A80]|uniref:lysoplasmalogenase n=1 Tax=Lutibacter sp. A80 TaxID=2918453 RepID=UPI001F070F0F|nr:lysoplasmalogenase [Lutibacter sp. A80]UMB60623.1 lysoplasmalogenase [Lutibacter sp. A80]
MHNFKLTFLFFLISFIDIIGIIFKIDSLVFLFKPFILLSLLFLYSHTVDIKNRWYVLALIFSFLGDVFLLYSGDVVFKFGLGSFLIAHLIYIGIVVKRIKKASMIRVFKAITPFTIVVLGLLFFLKDYLNELMIPVVIYAFTIAVFGMVSMLDYLNEKSKKAVFMLVGSIIFIVSDAVLAINKFYEGTHIYQIIVMVTYVSAQYLIYRSMELDGKRTS